MTEAAPAGDNADDIAGEVRRAVRRFVESEIAPLRATLDRAEDFPAELVRKLASAGYLGARMPAEYGGAELPLRDYCALVEELARGHPALTGLLDMTSGLAAKVVLRHGSADQKALWLQGLPAGTSRLAFALTEPGAGSDASAIQTKAEQGPNGWALTGTKHYISGGHCADAVVVIANVFESPGDRGKPSAFLVPQGTTGFSVARVDDTMGSNLTRIAELAFDGCLVPDEALLGRVGEGLKVAYESLDEGRLVVSAACIGAAAQLLDWGVEHAKTRTTFGQPLSRRQAIQWMLADSYVELLAARGLLREALDQVQAHQHAPCAASACKLYASEMVGRVADRVVQVFGGMGLVRGVPVEQFYRDVRMFRIGEGTSEIQRMVVAKALFDERSGVTP